VGMVILETQGEMVPLGQLVLLVDQEDQETQESRVVLVQLVLMETLATLDKVDSQALRVLLEPLDSQELMVILGQPGLLVLLDSLAAQEELAL